MNTHHMIFALNQNEKFIIDLFYSLDEILPFDMTEITLFSEHTAKLAKEPILSLLREFKSALKDAFDKKAFLSNPNKHDIGYIWNKVLKDDIADLNILLLQGETVKYWNSQCYIVWSTTGNMKPHITTWIYNDTDGNIVFHITPVLKNIFAASKKKFDLFMQSYKPFLIRTIPKDVAQTWLDQIDDALKIVESKLIK